MYFLLYGLVVALLWWVWKVWRYLGLYWTVGSRYPAVPFLGHGYLYMGDREKILKKFYNIGDHAIANGGLSATWMLHRFYLVVADAVDAEYVLKHHLEKDDTIGILRVFTRTSSLFSPVPIWRPHRKLVSKLLSVKNVNNFEPVFAKGSEVLVEQLRPLAGQGPFPIWERFNAYNLDVTCTTILGFDLNSQTDAGAPLRTAVNTIMELASDIVLQIWYHIDFIRERAGFHQTFLKHNQIIKDHVDEAMEKHTKSATGVKKGDVVDDAEPFSFLHQFAQMGEQLGLDRTNMHDEALGLLMAGTESTAIAAAMACVMMARRPDVQEKVYQELKDVFGDSDRLVTNEDLSRLRYLEAVVKETQRLYTAVPHITRKALEDFVLPSGVAVPKGTNFLISIYALNRNPKHWGADAEVFRPERFLDGSAPEAFFMFSLGPRGCNGVQFAMMAIKTALAALLRRYRVLPAAAPDAPLRFLFGPNVKAIDHFSVRIEERNPI